MSVEEIKKGVEERIYYNEFKWLENKLDIRYYSKCMAEGLENIFTTCPVCQGKYTIETKGNEVFCEKCGKLTQIDNRYAFDKDFRFKNFAKWYEWQKNFRK